MLTPEFIKFSIPFLHLTTCLLTQKHFGVYKKSLSFLSKWKWQTKDNSLNWTYGRFTNLGRVPRFDYAKHVLIRKSYTFIFSGMKEP